METLNYRMIQRKGKESELPSNPRDGEIYITTDTNTMYFGSNGKLNKVPTINDIGSGNGGSGESTTINNTLTSTSTTEALSAKMGNQLKINIDNHTKNNDIHVTSAEKAQWDAKAPTLVASATTNGLMTSDDKIKLNSIAVGATNTIINDTLTSTSATEALSANQGKVLDGKILSHEEKLATTNSYGHVKIGKGLTVSNGTIASYCNFQAIVPTTDMNELDNGIHYSHPVSNTGNDAYLQWRDLVGEVIGATDLALHLRFMTTTIKNGGRNKQIIEVFSGIQGVIENSHLFTLVRASAFNNNWGKWSISYACIFGEGSPQGVVMAVKNMTFVDSLNSKMYVKTGSPISPTNAGWVQIGG